MVYKIVLEKKKILKNEKKMAYLHSQNNLSLYAIGINTFILESIILSISHISQRRLGP